VNTDAPGHRRRPIGSGATYAGSGVSIAAGEQAVDLMKPYAQKTHPK